MTRPPRPLERLRALWALGRLLGGLPLGAGDVPWRRVVLLADDHQVTGALAVAIAARADLDTDPGIRDRLARSHRRNLVRNMLLRRQTLEAGRTLNRAGIEPLLLKGALYLFDGTLLDMGERFTGDIDIVVPEAAWDTAVAALESAGYRPEAGKPFLHPHELPMVARGRPTSVELHRSLGSAGVAAVLPLEEAWRDSSDHRVDGVSFRGLSPTHAALHNILHAQLQDLNHAVFGIPIRQLHTLYCLERAGRDRIDWELVEGRLREHALDAMARGYLDLARRLLGMESPVPGGPATFIHSLVSLASFEMGWPVDVHRNLRFALGAEYLDHLYGHGHRPARLLATRARHLYRVARARGRSALTEATLSRR